MTVYRWKAGAQYGVPAQVVGDRVEVLRDTHGRVTPSLLVEDATDPASPLHPCFEWDDSEAAVRWRKQQARNLLGKLVVVIREAPHMEPQRAYAACRMDDGERDYVPVSVALRAPDLREQVLRDALAGLRAWREKYANLNELADVYAAIDTVTATVAA